MGEVFSFAQIFNAHHLDKKDFLNLFLKRMMEIGYSTERTEDHELECDFSFTENNGWVSFCLEDWTVGSVKQYQDIQDISKRLQSPCMFVVASDSDMATITLFNGNGNLVDSCQWRDGIMDESLTTSTLRKEAWECFLVGEYTWGDVLNIQNNKNLTVLAKLERFSKLVGFNLQLNLGQNDDICSFHFKRKTIQVQSLNSILTNEFESSLRAYGFQRAKGRQPYYIRVTPGGEILHVIAFYEDKKAVTHDNKIAFDIMGGIATVYRRELTFSKNVRTNLNWMRSNGWIMANYKRLMPEYEFPQKVLWDDYRFYCERSPEAITNAIQHALEITKLILLPLMDQIVNIEACIKYRNILGVTMHTYYAEPANNFGNDRPNDFYNEGLLYFLVNPYVFRSTNPFPTGEFELKCYEVFEKIQNDYKLLERVKEELKRRKTQNIESLLSYGIDYHL